MCRWVGVPLKALFLVSIISNTEINIIFKCTNLKVVYRITLIVLVIGKAQFRRAMLSCDSSCYHFDSDPRFPPFLLYVGGNLG